MMMVCGDDGGTARDQGFLLLMCGKKVFRFRGQFDCDRCEFRSFFCSHSHRRVFFSAIVLIQSTGFSYEGYTFES